MLTIQKNTTVARARLLVGVSLFACAFLFGCSNTAKDRLVLVTGADPEHPYLQKQIEYFYETLKPLGYELVVEMHQSQICFELSNSGEVDGEMWRIEGVEKTYPNLIRVPTAIWSHPELAFVKEDIELSDWKSLAPYRVGFRKGTKVIEDNIEGIVERPFPLDTVEEAFDLLLKGEIDVVMSDNITGTLLLDSDKYRSSGIRIIEKPIDEALLYTYLNKKHASLVPELAKAISRTKADGTYARIVGEAPIAD